MNWFRWNSLKRNRNNSQPNNVPATEHAKARAGRREAARNSNTPQETLRQLADDEDAEVREELAGNSSTPVDILVRLTEDEYADVRGVVARNTMTPQDCLMKLAEDQYSYVRQGVARNLNTPPEILAKLGQDAYEEIRKAVKGNPNTPKEVLDMLQSPEESGPLHPFICSLRWSDLQATNSEVVRYCHECNKRVYQVETVKDATRMALLGRCIDAPISVWLKTQLKLVEKNDRKSIFCKLPDMVLSESAKLNIQRLLNDLEKEPLPPEGMFPGLYPDQTRTMGIAGQE